MDHRMTRPDIGDPNPPPKSAQLTGGEGHPAKHVKAYASYGGGFVQMPGTDTCISIGGHVSVDVAH